MPVDMACAGSAKRDCRTSTCYAADLHLRHRMDRGRGGDRTPTVSPLGICASAAESGEVMRTRLQPAGSACSMVDLLTQLAELDG